MQGWVDLRYVKVTNRELNLRRVNRKSNALPLSHHATHRGPMNQSSNGHLPCPLEDEERVQMRAMTTALRKAAQLLVCWLYEPECVNVLPQPAQQYGFSPLCRRLCSVRWCLCLNARWQTPHENGRRPTSTAYRHHAPSSLNEDPFDPPFNYSTVSNETRCRPKAPSTPATMSK